MERVVYENGNWENRDDYTKLFYTNLPLRSSSGKCPFSKVKRVSHFTVGDFWGVQNAFPKFYDNRGVYIVFLNTDRSVSIFDEIASTMELLETDIEHGMQPNLKGSSKIPRFRKLFWRDFQRRGVLYCAKKWPPIIGFPFAAKSIIKKMIRRFCW